MERLGCILCNVARKGFWVTDGIQVIRVLLSPPSWPYAVFNEMVENTWILLRPISSLLCLCNNPPDLALWDLEIRGDLRSPPAQGMQRKNMDSLRNGVPGAGMPYRCLLCQRPNHGRLLIRWTLGFILFGGFCRKIRE
jgi:hypothetical protein